MINIFELVTDTLSPLGYPVREQGSYGPNAKLPETLITYQLIASDNETHADNMPTSTTYRVQVALYSTRPGIVQAAEQTIRPVMLAAGFMRASGRSLPTDRDTGHYGYVTDYNYYDMEG